ncbi:putative reverse transcriptase domain-containing protein [Tanacetum coccineum]
MDKKLQSYAARSVESKRRMESNSRDNRGQQPPFKRQNISGQNVVRAYRTENNERRRYTGPLPLCNKCKYHHVGPCTVKCSNCKKVGHLTRDCTATITPKTQRAPVGNQQGVVCYECGRPGHFRKDCPKLRNQNRGNQTRNRVGNKTGNQTGGNEATAKAYAIGGGGTNPDSNVVTGTFLLNNCYASMLFDSGADRSFVSSTFSALLDITPSTLDTSYAVELAGGRILEINVVLRGCTLGLLGHPFDIDLMPVELGSFDVIIGMDWLAKYHALIVCDEKVVRIPYGDEVLIIRGDDYGNGSKLNIISCTKTQKYIQKGCQVMAISVISVSSDSSEDSVETPAGRVILFGTIPTTIPDTTPVITPPTTQTDTTVIPTETPIIAPTIPPSLDYTPVSLDYSPAYNSESDPSEDPSSDHIPPLLAILSFLSSADDTTDSDTPETPPSPTHGTPFIETIIFTQRSPAASGALRRRVMVLALGQPIPHGRPYHYHLNGLVYMITTRKRVGPLPTHHLAVRHSVDYSSSDHFSSDDSSSSLSSETSSDSSADALSDSASIRSSSDHLLPASPPSTRSSHRLCSLVQSVHHSSTISERPFHDSSSASRSRKRSRSPVASIPLSSPIPRALSYARVDLLPSPKRIRSPETATDLEDYSEDSFEPYVPREVGLGVNFEDESSEPSRSRGDDLEIDFDVVRSDGIEIDLEIQAEINECFAYMDALRDREIDARVVVEAVDREESDTGTRGPVKVRVERVTHHVMLEDTPKPTQEGAVEVTYETLGDLVKRFHDHSEAILVHLAELERDNRKLRGTVSVESQRVDRLQHSMARMQRELRQIRRFRFYDRLRVGRFEACTRKHMGYHP